MAEVHGREALLRAGVSPTQVGDAIQNLQLQQLVPAPAAPAPNLQRFSTGLWQLPHASALRQKQLEEMRGVCSLSERDFDSLSDIVKRGSRLPSLIFGAMMACLVVCLLSLLFFFLSGDVFDKSHDPPPYYMVGQASPLICFCLVPAYLCALPRANRQITRDLNQHFRLHARNFSFQLVVTKKDICCMETDWRLVVSFESRADGSV
ncbi:unnamed protein product [Symbiodinium natans]|uniref:Uncharacterized protein n=1 Tax=Symbiodinium natans TaxID=878477 RepID=A0A812TK67_9DINO|nr:unnamed protein product [Symbiodinium natans]